MRQATQAEALEITIRKFKQSKQGINDMTELLLVAAKNAGGMGWDDIEAIVKKAGE